MNFFPHIYSFFGFIGYLKNLSYPELYLIIISSGHFIPVPEPVTLIILGYLAGVGRSNIFGLFVVGVLAVMSFDLIVYIIGRSGSRLAHYLTKKVHTNILDKYTNASDFDLLILFTVSHFVPGGRIVNPIVAGITDIKFKKFLSLTLISAVLYTPVYLLVGYFFRTKIFLLARIFGAAHQMMVPIILLIIVLTAIVFVSLEKTKKVYNTEHAKE